MQHFKNDEVFIAKMTKDHIENVAELEKECFAEPWSAKSLEILLGESGIAFVAIRQNEVVAYAGMMTVLDEGQITNVAVSNCCRRLGFGRLVVEALINYAKASGLATISLEVRESNIAAISLYERCGFERCGIRKGFYRFPSEAAVIMTWTRD